MKFLRRIFKRKRFTPIMAWRKTEFEPGGYPTPDDAFSRPHSGEMVLNKQYADAMNINRIFNAYRCANPAPRVCKQCGAPLTGDKCEYCGTYYK